MTREVPKPTSLPRADKWLCLSIPERHMLHHALRVFCKYPLLPEEDRVFATALADELWELHVANAEEATAHGL